jgi:hypothetical protein
MPAIVRNDHPTASFGECQLVGITDLRHPLVSCCRYGEAPLAQGFNKIMVDALVQIDGPR